MRGFIEHVTNRNETEILIIGPDCSVSSQPVAAPSTILEPGAGKTETFAEVVYKHQPMINLNDLMLLQPMVAFIRK